MLDNIDESAEINSENIKVETKNIKVEVVNSEIELIEATDKAIAAVENEVAEAAENEIEKNEIPTLDYESMELEKLVEELEALLKNHPIQQIKNQTDAIKNAFNAKFGALLSEKKEAFLAEGGNSIDFQFSSPVKSTYNKLLSEYKTKRDSYYGELENQRKVNLEKRLEVIDALKRLIEDADTKTMYKQFRELQNTWRAIGPVPKTKYNDTWKIYHHHVERFYDLLHMSNDFRDLDFKHNLEEKLKVIEKAEFLADSEDINYAFKELQDLHKLWKEDIGPVAKDMREQIWQRFSAATKKIHDKRHEFFRELKSKYDEVIEVKKEIISKIENYDTSNNKTHKDWQNSIKEIEGLRKKYFDSGKLPYAKSEAIWQEFKKATKKFNLSKNTFYKGEKSDQQDNLKRKIALIELAESLKESEDWDMATEAMKKVQSDWKKIGHVPRKFSDDIWMRFKAACNFYFDRLHTKKNAVSLEQQAVVDTKKEFLENLSLDKITDESGVKELVTSWNNLGVLPKGARNLDNDFNATLDKLMKDLSIDKTEISMIKFKSSIEAYLSDNNVRKLDSEQYFVRKKIDETVREIQQLENNIGFISNAKDDNPLLVNVRNRIGDHKKDLEIWKSKLDYLKKLDY